MSTMISIWHTQHPVKYSNESRMRFTCTTSSLSSFIHSVLSPIANDAWLLHSWNITLRLALERLSCEHNFLINMSNFFTLHYFSTLSTARRKIVAKLWWYFSHVMLFSKNPLQHNIFASAMSMNILELIWDSFNLNSWQAANEK